MFKCLMSMCVSLSLSVCSTLLLLLPDCLPLFVQRQIIHMLNGVVILKRLMKLPKWLISQKRGVVVVIRSTNTSLAHSHFFLLRSLTLLLSRSLSLCRCLQVSAHVKPNDYNLLRDYEVSCILYIQFYAVKRCLINYTAVALALAAALIETATKK